MTHRREFGKLCFPILALLFSLRLHTVAQNEIMFGHLTVKEGLSQGSVLCILQDSRGFMWFGTQDGLNKFDGYEIKIFKHNPADPHSINDNFIVYIAEDSNRTLWFGTLNNPSILSKFDRKTETFTHIAKNSVTLSGAKVSQANMEYIDPSGVRWSGAQGPGLSRFDPHTGKEKIYKHDPDNPGSLLDNRIYSVVGDHAGTIWIGTREGLERFDAKSESFIHYRHDEEKSQSLSDNYVWPILEDRNGVLWVGTYRGGLNRFDRTTETFTHYVHEESNPRSLAGDLIYSLYQDASGMIWVGTGDHGVDRFHPDLSSFTHYLHNPSNPNSLAENNISSMFVDRSGIVWIGTRNGLNRWDRKTGKFILYKHDPTNPRSISDNMVQVMLEDRAGNFWIGTQSEGLEKFDRSTETFLHFRNNPNDPGSISDNRIYALCEDRSGDIWIGTYGNGLCRFDHNTRIFKRYLHSDSIATSIEGQGVWSLLEDRDGILWVGTYGGGLDRFNRENETFTHFAHSDSTPNGISDNIILDLIEDRAGTLWIGTTSGLNRFEPQSGKFRQYREKDGLANDVVFSVLEDDAGNFWMSTNKGLSRFDTKQGTFRNFNYDDGLQGNEFNQNAYGLDEHTGEMFFGGANGFNVFSPTKIKDNPYIPPVVFSSFNRYNTDDEQGKPIEEPGIDALPEISLSYKDNVANIKFAALNFYNTFKNRYAYKLEGFSDNWIQLGTDRRATFTNLDAGHYILRVRGSNNDGVWNDSGAVLSLVVTPPWWKTTWAYGIYLILLVGFLYSARTFEINQREQKALLRESELHAKAVEAEKRALQAENDRQTKELEDARKLQLSMLPKEIPNIPNYEISVFMKTATEVGGDYYDFNVTPEGVLDIAFGDATGHGMQAGTIVTLMKGLFISEASKSEIQNFFSHCSKAIKEIKLGRLYMALTLARFNEKSVSLSSAGMPPAYLYRKSDGSIEEILLKAVPLGSMKNFPYSLYETPMEKGDTLLFLTDGLPEQKNAGGEMFDYAKVIDSFKSVAESAPEKIIAQLVKEGEAWMNGVAQDDDITLLVIRRKE
jgi:ligand-binding sensor domain-containing protein/serine phosphatase RsbU (regulator of sigma subunit)